MLIIAALRHFEFSEVSFRIHRRRCSGLWMHVVDLRWPRIKLIHPVYYSTLSSPSSASVKWRSCSLSLSLSCHLINADLLPQSCRASDDKWLAIILFRLLPWGNLTLRVNGPIWHGEESWGGGISALNLLISTLGYPSSQVIDIKQGAAEVWGSL